MENENLNFNGLSQKKESPFNKKLGLKVIVMAVIVLLLLIPKALIEGTISEREDTARNAMSEVFSKMGGEQTIVGPYFSFGCIEKDRVKTVDDGYQVVESPFSMFLLPNTLNVEGDVQTSRRHRGIYEVVTFNSPLEIKGDFAFSESDEAEILKHNSTGLVKICFDISDLKGVSDEVKLTLGNKEYSLVPDGDGLYGSVKRLSALIDQNVFENSKKMNFSMKLSLKGSESLQFVPVGKKTTLHLKSDCETPSFCGDILPVNAAVDGGGFDRRWEASYMNRSYPQLFRDDQFRSEVKSSSFGVNLLVPVGHYQKTMRCVKYCLLFIILTFAVFFFIELIQKKNIHPVQYTLVGLALMLFYSLLLSFSEHIGFMLAYVVSSVMTIALLSIYMSAVLKIRKTALCVGGMLAVLYVYIFVLIQMETYAMLAGSLGLFMILGVIMYFSQKIDWSNPQQ